MGRGGKRSGAGRKPGPKPEVEQPKRLPWRPTSYDPSYCDLVIDLMQQGFSLTGFAGKIGVSRQTVTNWMNEYPDFLASALTGKAVRAAAWEDQAVRVAKTGGGPGTAQIIIFSLKNMAPDEYSDTQNLRHAGPDGEPLPTAQTVIVLPHNGRNEPAKTD